MVLGEPLGTIACLIGSCPDNRYRFQIVEQHLNPSRKWLVAPMMVFAATAPVDLSAYLVRPVIIVVCRAHS